MADPSTGSKTDSDAGDDLEAAIAAASRQLEETAGPPRPGDQPLDDQPLVCANHPATTTMLRCNRCGKPICTRCAIRTPVGYRCRECIGRQQAPFFTGGLTDYLVGAAIGLVLGGAACLLMVLLSWFFALILGPTVGVGIAEAVRLAVRRRRSRYLWLAVSASMVAGGFLALLSGLARFSVWTLVTLALFLVLSVGAAAARLR